jgi:GT2 family glycosyltransferase
MVRLYSPSTQPASDADLIAQTTAIIKTFQRPDCLNRLIRSIRRYYPTMRVLVGDDGYKPSPCRDVEYFRLPIDIGLSAGRNALLDEVRTPYFLLLDDDLEFRSHTKIEKLVRLVHQNEVDIASGGHVQIKRKWFLLKKRPQPFHGLFDFRNNELRLVHGDYGQRDGYLLCDIAHNFYVARVDTIRMMGAWDPELRQNDHTEFFVRARRHDLRVGYCQEVISWHWMSRPEGYTAFRNRSFHHIAAQKIGVDRIINFQGKVFAFDGPNATIMNPSQAAQLKRAA